MKLKVENEAGVARISLTDPADGLTTVFEVPDGQRLEIAVLPATSASDFEIGDVEPIPPE